MSWSTSWPGALHLTFHTFLHPISVFFSQHMPIHRNLFCCSIKIISSIPSLSLNSLLGTLSFTLTFTLVTETNRNAYSENNQFVLLHHSKLANYWHHQLVPGYGIIHSIHFYSLSPLKKVMFTSLFVCPFVSNYVQKLPDLHEIFRKGWQWADEQMIMITFWWRSGSPSGYRDCFPDSSQLGDTESRINRLHCATWQYRACTSRHHHSNYGVTTSPAYDSHDRHALAEVGTVPMLLVRS